jgi:hypothetical protein
MSCPLLTPVGETGSGYPTNVYDCNKLSLPILRQKMAQSCGRMFIDLPDGCCYRDQNTSISSIFPVSEQKIILSNRITNNQMKQNGQSRNGSKFEMIEQNK